MSTRGIIDRVLPWCPGWERSSGRKNLLKVLQQGVDKLFNWDNDIMVYRGTDNQGFPPYLITTAGEYDYSVSSANLSCGAITRNIGGTDFTLVAKRVKKIFIDTSGMTPPYFDVWTGQPYRINVNPYNIGSETRLFIADIGISSQPGYENTAPTVKFQKDPGTHSDKYFIEFLIGAPRLTSENIEIPIPEDFEEDLETYIIGFVQWRESGRKSDNLLSFETESIPNFREYMGSCSSTDQPYTPPRKC